MRSKSGKHNSTPLVFCHSYIDGLLFYRRLSPRAKSRGLLKQIPRLRCATLGMTTTQIMYDRAIEVIPQTRAAKLRGGLRTGFTLVEILVAVTIIVTIVSMVYGSYFATAKSTDVCKARMILSGQTRRVLRQMARQIRCSYIGKTQERSGSAGTISKEEWKITEKPIIYFNCEPDARGGEILHIITTNGLFCQEGQAYGLFDVTYKFDKNSGTLSLGQIRFVGTPERLIEKRNWRPLLRNVECIELDFFDGQQWLSKWDFKQKKKLPYAVKIGITSKDENHRQCHYGTIAHVGCSGNQSRETLSETLESVGK